MWGREIEPKEQGTWQGQIYGCPHFVPQEDRERSGKEAQEQKGMRQGKNQRPTSKIQPSDPCLAGSGKGGHVRPGFVRKKHRNQKLWGPNSASPMHKKFEPAPRKEGGNRQKKKNVTKREEPSTKNPVIRDTKTTGGVKTETTGDLKEVINPITLLRW